MPQRTQSQSDESEAGDELAPLTIESNPAAAIDAWLAVFARLLHLPEPARSQIRDELREHLRERVRDLLLSGSDESDAVRLAIEELGETAQLARRFEAADRPRTRRLLMNLTLIGLGVGTVAVAAYTLNRPAPAPSSAVAFEEALKQAPPPAEIVEKRVDLNWEQTPLHEAAEYLSRAVDLPLIVRWQDLEEAGVDPQTPLDLKAPRLAYLRALELTAAAASTDAATLEFRVSKDVLELALQRTFDHRESTMVAYDISAVLDTMRNRYNRPYENAREDLVQLLMEMVEPIAWVANGGDLARLTIVGGRMFIQAPPRMHEKIKWIIDQLSAEDQPAAPAHGAAGVPVLKDVPLLNHFLAPPEAREQQQQQAEELESINRGLKVKQRVIDMVKADLDAAKTGETFDQAEVARMEDLLANYEADAAELDLRRKHIFEEQYAKALHRLERAKKTMLPDSAEYLMRQGEVDKAAEALKAYEDALKRDPDTRESSSPSDATLNDLKQQYQRALQEFNTIKEQYRPDTAQYRNAQTALQAARDALGSHSIGQLAVGDWVVLEVFELFKPNEWHTMARQVEPTGKLRFPEIGEVEAAGREPSEVEQAVVELLKQKVMANPSVSLYRAPDGAVALQLADEGR